MNIPVNLAAKITRIKHALYRVKVKLLYTSAPGAAFRRWLWKEVSTKDGLVEIYRQTIDVFGAHHQRDINDIEAVRRFKDENRTYREQDDIIFVVENDVIIEPDNGLAFLPSRRIVAATRGSAHKYLVPNFRKVWQNVWRETDERGFTKFPALVHFDGFVSRNLYHFFHDALNPLILLLDSGLVDRKIPILIHERLFCLPYVQYFIKLPYFEELNWVLQREGEWIQTSRLIKAVSTHDKWRRLKEILPHRSVPSPRRRVFLNRREQFQRRLSNNNEIEALLIGKGFEVIYSEDLCYDDQVRLFSETAFLVALHGAGMTNLLHSNVEEVRVLEIQSVALLQPHFYWMLGTLEIPYYDAIVGSEFDINWNYSIDLVAFMDQVDKLLAA